MFYTHTFHLKTTFEEGVYFIVLINNQDLEIKIKMEFDIHQLFIRSNDVNNFAERNEISFDLIFKLNIMKVELYWEGKKNRKLK